MSTPAGWHPDPLGRHQHRFWDGQTWTDQVADDGATSSDPIPDPSAGAETSTPGAPPWSGAPASGPVSTPATPGGPLAPGVAPAPPSSLPPSGFGGAPALGAQPPAPSGGRSKLPILIGVFVVVAVAVAGAFILFGGGDDDGSGPGDFQLQVADDALTVHTVKLQAGDVLAFRADKAKDIRVALGIDQASAERLAKSDVVGGSDLTDLYSDANSTAGQLFSDVPAFDSFSDVLSDVDSNELAEVPGYDGILVGGADYDEIGDDDAHVSSYLIAPTDMTVDLVLLSKSGKEDVDLRVRVGKNSSVSDETLTSDQLDGLYSDAFYTDFVDQLTDEWDVTS